MSATDLEDPTLFSPGYLKLEKLCSNIEANLQEKIVDFASAAERIESVVDDFHGKVASYSLLSMILYWAKLTAKDKVFGSVYLDLMNDLIDKDLIPIHTEHKKIGTLSDFARIGHESIINRIRSYQDWVIRRREELVTLYVIFGNWLSEKTFGYVPKAIDPDRKMAAKRVVPYDKYILLLSFLPTRERILAKLYYLGGERSMEQVLSLEVSHIDFVKHRIYFGEHFVNYPDHVFADLKIYLGRRVKGFVFTKKSKSNERINNTVPYRALKRVASELKLPASFSYRDLVKEV